MPPRPFLTQDWRCPELLFPPPATPILTSTHPQPPKTCEPEKLTEIKHFTGTKKKKGGGGETEKEGNPLKMLPGFGRGQAPHTHTQLLGEEGDTPCGSRTWGAMGFPPKNIHGDLEERCRTGRGLGVSLLRLWPGERLSPR